MSDSGARNSATTFPIIRGLNASPGAGSFRTFEQAPVGTYIGNSPIDGYFQFNDIERIEVLRGPQGTLYGAGALGGALRIIPAAPKLGEFSGNADVKLGMVDQASDPSYTTGATVNLPLGETFALRVSGNYDYEPGFIDAHGLMRLDDNGIPVRADPSDPNSSGVYYSKEDWNDQKTFTGRASLLWQPTDNFNATLAYMYSDLDGHSGRTVNRTFPGGEFVGDPRIILPPGGDNTRFSAIEEPYSRQTDLASLDLSYDAGFATLSSTSSYFTTEGDTTLDSSYVLYRIPQYLGYYVGNTLNPRFILPQVYGDKSHTFTQEVRLVSNAEPGKKFDYVAGVFYEKQTRIGSWLVSIPGSPERSQELGCTGIWFPGANFPDCLVLIGPNDVNVDQHDEQTFEDKSIFGELTWHFTEHGDLTVGVRHFEQDFKDVQSLELYSFGLSVPEEPRTSKASKTKWKVNPVVRIRAQSSRVRGVVAGLPPRRLERDSAGRPVRRQPGADHVPARRSRQLRDRPEGPLRERPELHGRRLQDLLGQPADRRHDADHELRRVECRRSRIEGLRARSQRAVRRHRPEPRAERRVLRRRVLEGLPGALDVRRHRRLQGSAAARQSRRRAAPRRSTTSATSSATCA